MRGYFDDYMTTPTYVSYCTLQLRFELETCDEELKGVREQFSNKKKECGALEDQVVDLQAEVGKWKFMAESKAGPVSPQQDDMRRKVSDQEGVSPHPYTLIVRWRDLSWRTDDFDSSYRPPLLHQCLNEVLNYPERQAPHPLPIACLTSGLCARSSD